MKFEKINNFRDDKEQNDHITRFVEEKDRMKMVKEILSLVNSHDRESKALTGRTPEKYAAESGIDLEFLIPENSKTLNIGDPYQKLDLPGVTILDYESGEEADFNYDYKKILESFDEHVLKLFEEIISAYAIYCKENKNNKTIESDYKNLMEINKSLNVNETSEFDKYGDFIINASYNLGDPSNRRNDQFPDQIDTQDVWYKMQKLSRYLKDIYLWEHKINKSVLEESIRLRGIDEQKTNEIIQKTITKERFFKKTVNAEVIKGAWPEVYFDDNTFDRFIASWSISAHIFSEMNREQLLFSFKEVTRVLNKDGIAFIWPMDYYWSNYEEFRQAINDFSTSNSDAAILNDRGFVLYSKNPEKFIEETYHLSGQISTFILFKNKPDESTLEKLTESIIIDDYSIKANQIKNARLHDIASSKEVFKKMQGDTQTIGDFYKQDF